MEQRIKRIQGNCIRHYLEYPTESTTPTQASGYNAQRFALYVHKVVAVGFNTLCYDASVGVLNPPHE